MAKLQAASVLVAYGICAPTAAAPWDRQTDRQTDGRTEGQITQAAAIARYTRASRGYSGNAFVVYLSTFIVKKVSSALLTILSLHFCMCLPTSNEVSKNLPTIIAVVVFQRILLVVRG